MHHLAEILGALRNHEQPVLATIVGASGSTPLPSGSSLLIRGEGRQFIGTIGGGALEAHVIEAATRFSAGAGESKIRQFELDEPDAVEGMICGGTVEVLIERLGEKTTSVFSTLQSFCNEGRDCMLLRGVDASGVVIRYGVCVDVGDDAGREPSLEELRNSVGVEVDTFLQQLQRSGREDTVRRVAGLSGEIIVQPLTGVQALIIFGGGHIGKALSSIASHAGFKVTVVDDREEYAVPSRFPGAGRVLCRSWRSAWSELTVHPSTSIVIATRGHEFDKQVLQEALRTSARYIGMIGSRTKVATTYSALKQGGVSTTDLKRVSAPIGLDIGAVTAEEIAVSIVAQLVLVRRQSQGTPSSLSSRMDSWFDQEGKDPRSQ